MTHFNNETYNQIITKAYHYYFYFRYSNMNGISKVSNTVMQILCFNVL